MSGARAPRCPAVLPDRRAGLPRISRSGDFHVHARSPGGPRRTALRRRARRQKDREQTRPLTATTPSHRHVITHAHFCVQVRDQRPRPLLQRVPFRQHPTAEVVDTHASRAPAVAPPSPRPSRGGRRPSRVPYHRRARDPRPRTARRASGPRRHGARRRRPAPGAPDGGRAGRGAPSGSGRRRDPPARAGRSRGDARRRGRGALRRSPAPRIGPPERRVRPVERRTPRPLRHVPGPRHRPVRAAAGAARPGPRGPEPGRKLPAADAIQNLSPTEYPLQLIDPLI